MDMLTTLISGAILAASSAGQGCVMPKPASINVRPQSDALQVISKYTLGELQQVETDTVNPHSFSDFSVAHGFMRGMIRMQPAIKLDYSADPRTGRVCLWYDEITVNVRLTPQIYIAKEVHEDRCMRKATMDHEMKHVRVDREVINEFSRSVGKAIFEALQERGFKAGPMPAAMSRDAADRMRRTVYQIVEHEYKKLELIRTERQRAVDSREEYDRVQAQCPGFKEPPESLKMFLKERMGR